MLHQIAIFEGELAANYSWADFDREYSRTVKTESRRRSAVSSSSTVAYDTAFRLAATAMSLKVYAARFSGHLSQEQRSRLFEELDFLLDPDGWYEKDSMPAAASLDFFLKWSIASGRHGWSSLGLDGDGNFLVAFVNAENLVTAAFLADGTVHWTAKIREGTALHSSAGVSQLVNFIDLSAELLDRL